MECPYCGSSAMVRDNFRGKEVCTRCGLVLLEKEMSKEAEWYSEPWKKKGRADISSGSDITQHDLGLGSRIGKSTDISPAWRSKLRRLKKWQRRSRAVTYEDKSLRKALIYLDKLCEDLSLSKSFKEEISVLVRKARKEEVTPGRNIWNILAALVFIVGRIRRIPRTEKEIAEALANRSGISKEESFRALRRTRKVLAKELDLDVPRPRPKEYLDRFASFLEVSSKVKSEAHKLCNSLPEGFKARKASFLVSAAILYNASKKIGEKLKIREVADTLNVGVSSLSKTGQKVRELSSHYEI